MNTTSGASTTSLNPYFTTPDYSRAGKPLQWRGVTGHSSMDPVVHKACNGRGERDIERSKRFYNAVLGVLGAVEAMLNVAGSGHTSLFYRDKDGTNFIISGPINDEPATVANGSTVAFSCHSPEQIELFHATTIANGGTSIDRLPKPTE